MKERVLSATLVSLMVHERTRAQYLKKQPEKEFFCLTFGCISCSMDIGHGPGVQVYLGVIKERSRGE